MTGTAEGPGASRDARTLLFYRLTVLFLLLIVAGLLLVRPAEPTASQPVGAEEQAAAAVPEKRGVLIADLAAMASDIARRHSSHSDFSKTYYETPSASVHLHAMGFEQTCPLHVHRKTEELTVIVTGMPEVTHVFARDEELVRADGSYGPGTLIYSPAFCGHKWVNRAKDSMQTNLVFATPPFDGNFYLEQDDYRLRRGGPPVISDPDEDLRSFLADGEPYRLKQLSGMDGKMSSLLVKEEMGFDADSSPTLIYVTRGEGSLLADREYPIRHQQLALVIPETGVRVRATPGAPMAMIVFRPEAGEEVRSVSSR